MHQEYMYSTLSFALALCDSRIFQSPSSRRSPVPHTHPPGGVVEFQEAVVAEMRAAGWWLVTGGMLYLGSWGLVLGIPGRIGLCGFALVALGAILISGGFSGHCSTSKPMFTPLQKKLTQTSDPPAYSQEPEPTSNINVPDIDTLWGSIWLLRGYFTIIYFYAGVAKLETDWLGGWTIRELLRLWTGTFVAYCLGC